MLVLTRKQNEKICIGDNITITVIRMKGKSVRLGIKAPNNVNVLRGELVFDSANDSADIHCESSHCESNEKSQVLRQAAEDTIIECRISRDDHSPLAI